MHIELAFIAIAPAFMLICIGILLRQTSFLHENFWPSAEKITHYILFPAFLISSIGLAGNLDASSKTVISILSGISLIITIIVVVGCRLLRVEHAVVTSVLQGSIRFNSFIFLSISAGLMTPQQYGVSAVVVAYMVAISNTIVLFTFEKAGRRPSKLIGVIGKVILNPLILASVIGVTLNLAHLSVGPVVGKILEILGASALPVSLMCVGAALKLPRNNEQIITFGFSTAAIRLLLFPALGLVAIRVFDVTHFSAYMIMLYCVLPCASNSYVLSKQYGGDHNLMAFVVALSTLLSFIPIFFVVSFM